MFPGGKVQEWRVIYGEQKDVVHTSVTANVDCGEIAPNGKVRLLSEQLVPMVEGLAWIRCKIDPKGEDKVVEYYQEPRESVSSPKQGWLNCFYVVDRGILLLTSIVEDLAKRSQQ